VEFVLLNSGPRSASVGLNEEMNWIIAIVGFCSLSEGNYPWIDGGE